jgi:hypothetical protein
MKTDSTHHLEEQKNEMAKKYIFYNEVLGNRGGKETFSKGHRVNRIDSNLNN